MGDERTQAPQQDTHQQDDAGKNSTRAKTPASAYYPTHLSITGTGAPDSPPLTRDNLLYLQRTIGNHAAGQLLYRKAKSTRHDADPGVMQSLLSSEHLRAKLEVGNADDPAEREAEQVAEAAVQGRATCACPPGAPSCPKCQASGGVVRRKPSSAGAAADADNISLGTGRPLDGGERSFFDSRMNADLSGVRLHDNEQAASSAAQISARAFTLGSDIAFGRDQYRANTSDGQLLLAHELAHVLQQDGGASPQTIRRVGLGEPPMGYFPGEREVMERARAAEAARERHHAAWVGGVNQRFGGELANQARTVGEERERIELALTSQRAAAMDAVAGGQGWLNEALRNQGYGGPGLVEVKQYWAEALVAAELIKMSGQSGAISPETRLAGLQAVPTFYNALATFARAAEQAHQTHVQQENARLRAQYEAQLEQHERAREMDRETTRGFGGEPGASAAAAGMAMSREMMRPRPPTYLEAPPAVSEQVAPATERVYAADTNAQWATVAGDVNRLGNGLATLVVRSLPERSDIRQGVEYLEQLDTRLATLERTHPVSVRIPAVFYPKDRTITRRGQGGEELLAPESIPWQFYLTNTAVTSRDQPVGAEGEWVLIDLTSGQRFQNTAPASESDSLRFQRGWRIDPPLELFSHLNSRIRFPEGRIYFSLPSGANYYVETTEPWSLSDWLSAIGIALAAIALTAAAVATGGAATPAAVAFYAGLGATAASIGSTLASLHERSEQGILTSGDVDSAMISIGIDVVTAASMGLGRLVAAPRAAARLGFIGERFVTLRRVTQGVRGGALAGDVYQAWSLTSGLLSAFNAIENQPGLGDEERSRMRGQLARRALITGTLMVVAIRGDIQDLRAGGTLQVSHVDTDGALVVGHADATGPHGQTDAPSPHADTSGASTAAHAAPHADVAGPVHENSARAGSGITVGPQTHAVAAAGSGRNRDFYFCSDLCGPLIRRLEAIIEALPHTQPEREIFQELLGRVRGASRRLKQGRLTEDEANAIAQQVSNDIARHSRQSDLFSALMNTDPAVLVARRREIRQRLSRARDIETTRADTEAEGRQANQSVRRGGDRTTEPDPHSPFETDILGGFGMHEAATPGGRAMPIRFDAGIFAHTHAEALVPGLPRGLDPEVRITMPDGSVGRADRVRFFRDADGDIVGAHVYEIKPNTDTNIALGERQVQEYVQGLRAEIERNLAQKGKAMPATAPDRGATVRGEVMTYNQEQMLAVLRALRSSRRDALRMAEYEAIARQVFSTTP
jgi:hypothetical protein